MEFTRKYEDILQNIEATVVYFYRANPEVMDVHVMRVLEIVRQCLSGLLLAGRT
jgi:hypothetical protein